MGYKRPTVRKLLQEWRDQQRGVVPAAKVEPLSTSVRDDFNSMTVNSVPETPSSLHGQRTKRVISLREQNTLAEIARREQYLSDPKQIPVVRRGGWNSLTQFIDANKEIKLTIPRDLRYYVTDQFGKPVNWKTPILVPCKGNFVDASQVGTAFDYVVRAMLARKCLSTPEPVLIAERGIRGLRFTLGVALSTLTMRPPKYLLTDPEKLQHNVETLGWLLQQEKSVVRFTEEALEKAVARRKDFISGEDISLKDIMADALFLARLDEIYRSGGISIVNHYLESQGRPRLIAYGKLSDSEILAEIQALVNVFAGFLDTVSWQSVILNPEFDGKCIRAAADGDFIVDRTLVDIKTVTSLSCKGDYFAQVFAYVSLGRKMGMDIDTVAIYFARFNQFVSIRLDDPVLLKDFPERYLNAMIEIAHITPKNDWNKNSH